ncbi:hypothetical protein L1887_18596 [Cichorium endivia]|nr:hypothetical protein L1887_18596 [Cichorium endivia]
MQRERASYLSLFSFGSFFFSISVWIHLFIKDVLKEISEPIFDSNCTGLSAFIYFLSEDKIINSLTYLIRKTIGSIPQES